MGVAVKLLPFFIQVTMDEAKDYNLKEQVIELGVISEIKKLFDRAAQRLRDIALKHLGEKDFSWDKYPGLKKQALEVMEETRKKIITKVGSGCAAAGEVAAEMNKDLYDIEDTGEFYDYNEELYGKTFKERLGRYSNLFLSAMALIIAAKVTVSFAYSPGGSAKVLALGRKLPSIGRGDSGSPTKNVQTLAEDIIRRSYHHAYYQAWKKAGIVGYEIFRGSSFDCPICNTLPGKVYPISSGMILPAHVRCVCYAVPVIE